MSQKPNPNPGTNVPSSDLIPSARPGHDRGAGVTRELEPALDAARRLPPNELPRLLGDLEEVRATALARLTAPAPQQQAQPDELLDVAEAARRLGVSTQYLYRHHPRLPFTRRVGRKLLFSALGIAQYLRHPALTANTSLTARR